MTGHSSDLSGKRALVTGAAGGLGLASASALAHLGAQVVIADRNVEAGRQAAAAIGGAARFVALDLADLAGVRAVAASLANEPLDILVNNAGILPSLTRQTTRDGFELAFGIQLGHFALTALLWPALVRAPAARVVCVSSLVQAYAKIDFDDLNAERRYEPQRAYNQAKLAALMFALELNARARRAGSSARALAAHPGVARTAIGDARRREPPRRLRDRLELWALDAMMRWFGQSAERGADCIVHAAAAPDAQGGEFYGPDGFRQFGGAPVRVSPSLLARDAALRTRLWDESERLTGLRFPPE